MNKKKLKSTVDALFEIFDACSCQHFNTDPEEDPALSMRAIDSYLSTIECYDIIASDLCSFSGALENNSSLNKVKKEYNQTVKSYSVGISTISKLAKMLPKDKDIRYVYDLTGPGSFVYDGFRALKGYIEKQEEN